MIVAVPTQGKNLDAEVNSTFGRASNIVFVNTDAMDFEVIENPGASAQGGAGIKAAQALVDKKAEVLIAFECGQNAANVLKAAGISIYKSVPGTVIEVISKLKAGELVPLLDIHAGYHQHGGDGK